MIDIRFENGASTSETDIDSLRACVESSCKAPCGEAVDFALIESDNEVCRFNGFRYAYAFDVADFMERVKQEVEDNEFAIVFEVHDAHIPVWVWIVR